MVKISTEEETVQLIVVNQGKMIPSDNLARIFDRFFRADPSRADAPTNHGLGLAIVSAIARMHGGHPIAESDPNATSVGLRIARYDSALADANRTITMRKRSG